MLPLDQHHELLQAHPDFMLVASYNPGGPKELKPSTRQRFCMLDFGYPEAESEVAIVAREAGIDSALATRLVALGLRTRRLQGHGLDDGASTRMLVHAGQLIRAGIPPAEACRAAVATPLSDEPELAAALQATVDASF
jgi:nitric oxide reductase NorQ protein